MPEVEFDKINIERPQNTKIDIQQLKEEYTMVDLLNKLNIPVNEKGNSLCPLHNDTSPSFSLSEDLKSFRCFGCSLSGDMFDFTGEYFNIAGTDNLYYQIEKICEIFNIPFNTQSMSSLTNISDTPQLSIKQKQSAYDLLMQICEHHHKSLLDNPDMLEYAISRFRGALGEDDSLELIKKYKIGYSQDYTGHIMKKLGLEPTDALITGFVLKDKSECVTEFVHKRLIFPYWKNNRIIYAIARQTKFTDSNDLAKYKKLLVHGDKHPYSALENVLFYGENEKNKGNEHYVVICEGIIEALICRELGINIISPITKQVNNSDLDRLRKIGKKVKSVYIVNDNESSNAGFEGALKTGLSLLPIANDIRIVKLPRGREKKVDLADYFNKGNSKKDLLSLCESSDDIIEFLISQCEDSEKPQTALIKADYPVQTMAKYKDNLLQYDHYIDLLIEKTHCKRNDIIKLLNKYQSSLPKEKNKEKQKDSDVVSYDAGSENFTVESYALFQRKNGKDDSPKQVATFTGILEREISYDDGASSANSKRSYEGMFMCAPDGETHKFSINAEDFADPKLFRKCVANTLGPKGNYNPGYEGLLINYINAQTNNAGKPKKEVVYNHTGWSRDYKMFYYPKFSIDKEMSKLEETLRVELVKKDLNNPMESNIGNYNKFEFIREESKENILNYLKEGVFNGLLKIFNYSITLPCVATVFLPILFPFIKDDGKKYLLWIYGPTGTGKTMMASMLASFYGDFTSELPPVGWGSTPWAVERWGFCLPNTLANVDDYKYANVGEGNRKQMLIQVIQNYSDQTSRMRLNQNSEMKPSYPIRGFLVSSGEDLPSGEPSTVARLLPIEINTRGNTKIFHKTKEIKKYFRAITPSFIHWFINQHDLNTLDYSCWFRKKQEEYQNRIEAVLGNPNVRGNNNEKRDSTQNVNRMASNLAMNVLGLEMFLKYSEYMGIDKIECDKLSMVYNDNLDELIKKYAAAIIEESQTTAVIDIAMEILGSNDVYIEHLNDGNYFGDDNHRPAYGAKKIGFAKGDFVYILPNVLLNEVQKIKKSMSVSRADLFRQLNIKGLTEAGENKDSTVNILIKQNEGDRGVPTNVLKFYRQVFTPEWKNIVVKPDISGIEKELATGGNGGVNGGENKTNQMYRNNLDEEKEAGIPF